MNKKSYKCLGNSGQALVEFVLILPVFLFMLFSVYDFGMIFVKKNTLENSSSDIVNLYKDGISIDEIKMRYNKLSVEFADDGEYKKVTISDKIKLITPGFNRIFGNPYVINVERYIFNE